MLLVHHVISRGRDNRRIGRWGQLVTLDQQRMLFLRRPMPMMMKKMRMTSSCMNVLLAGKRMMRQRRCILPSIQREAYAAANYCVDDMTLSSSFY